MPDQGSLISGLKARIGELESRGFKLESQLRLQQEVKYLRRENARLRELGAAGPSDPQAQVQMQLLLSENSTLRSQNLAPAAPLHAAEKRLKVPEPAPEPEAAELPA